MASRRVANEDCLAPHMRAPAAMEPPEPPRVEHALAPDVPAPTFEAFSCEPSNEQDGEMSDGSLQEDESLALNNVKEKIRLSTVKHCYTVTDFYHRTGIFRLIARHQLFENATLTVISVNALWIAIDTDLNFADVLLKASPVFQIVEHLFCLYFALEWFVRFMSFRRKKDGLKDGWFTFDTCLVSMMVLETWVMTTILLIGGGGGGGLGGVSILRIARLMRLSRMARMARLFRAMPELLILIKGMMGAFRSVFFTLCLLALLVYVFGIGFRQLTDGTDIGNEKFGSVLVAMHTLLLEGTILDNPGEMVVKIGEESIIFVVIFYIFIVLSALMVMNMLIGVLCEVVSAVAKSEREGISVAFVKSKLLEIFQESGLDQDGDMTISKEEFSQILQIPEASNCLEEVGVDVIGLVDNIDFIFMSEGGEDGVEKKLGFNDMTTLLLDMRGSNNCTVRDMVELRKFIMASNRRIRDLCIEKPPRKSSVARVRTSGVAIAKVKGEDSTDEAQQAHIDSTRRTSSLSTYLSPQSTTATTSMRDIWHEDLFQQRRARARRSLEHAQEQLRRFAKAARASTAASQATGAAAELVKGGAADPGHVRGTRTPPRLSLVSNVVPDADAELQELLDMLFRLDMSFAETLGSGLAAEKTAESPREDLS